MALSFACGRGGCAVRWTEDAAPLERTPEVELLRERRIRWQGRSQYDMAALVGMDVVAFSKAENGHTTFTPEQLARYHEAVDGCRSA